MNPTPPKLPVDELRERLDGRGYTAAEIPDIIRRWSEWYDQLVEQSVVRPPGPTRSVTVANLHEYVRPDCSIAYDAKGNPLHRLVADEDASIIVRGYQEG